MDRPTFHVLGPVRATRAGSFCALGGPRQQMVLAVLLANANRLVARETLVDAVWDGNPPSAADASLDAYLSRLRAELGRGVISRECRSYTVEADEESLDTLAFERSVVRGASVMDKDPGRAALDFDEALALWRGQPYGRLGGSVVLAPEVARLCELRASARELRAEAMLTLGRHHSVLIELQEMVREHPFREHMVAQLMLALYRSGRQAEALGTFRDMRVRLAQELGIDPSDELWQMEDAILRHDPALLARTDVKPLATISPSGNRSGERGVLRPGAGSVAVHDSRRTAPRVLVTAIALILIVLGVPSRTPPVGASCVEPPEQLVAWWTADGTTLDMIGSMEAKPVGAPTFEDGVAGHAFVFDGEDDYLEVAHDERLDVGTRDFTVDMWVRFDSTVGEQVIAEKWVQRHDGPSVGWTLTKLADNSIGISTGASIGVSSPPLDLPPKQWTHIAARRSGRTIEILRDGRLIASYSASDDVSVPDLDSTSSLKFGHRGGEADTPGAQGTQGLHLAGAIDEAHLTVGLALSDEELILVREAGAAGYCR